MLEDTVRLKTFGLRCLEHIHLLTWAASPFAKLCPCSTTPSFVSIPILGLRGIPHCFQERERLPTQWTSASVRQKTGRHTEMTGALTVMTLKAMKLRRRIRTRLTHSRGKCSQFRWQDIRPREKSCPTSWMMQNWWKRHLADWATRLQTVPKDVDNDTLHQMFQQFLHSLNTRTYAVILHMAGHGQERDGHLILNLVDGSGVFVDNLFQNLNERLDDLVLSSQSEDDFVHDVGILVIWDACRERAESQFSIPHRVKCRKKLRERQQALIHSCMSGGQSLDSLAGSNQSPFMVALGGLLGANTPFNVFEFAEHLNARVKASSKGMQPVEWSAEATKLNHRYDWFVDLEKCNQLRIFDVRLKRLQAESNDVEACARLVSLWKVPCKSAESSEDCLQSLQDSQQRLLSDLRCGWMDSTVNAEQQGKDAEQAKNAALERAKDAESRAADAEQQTKDAVQAKDAALEKARDYLLKRNNESKTLRVALLTQNSKQEMQCKQRMLLWKKLELLRDYLLKRNNEPKMLRVALLTQSSKQEMQCKQRMLLWKKPELLRDYLLKRNNEPKMLREVLLKRKKKRKCWKGATRMPKNEPRKRRRRLTMPRDISLLCAIRWPAVCTRRLPVRPPSASFVEEWQANFRTWMLHFQKHVCTKL